MESNTETKKRNSHENLEFRKYFPKLEDYKYSQFYTARTDDDGVVRIMYRADPFHVLPSQSTNFSLQIEPEKDTCYILTLDVEESKRRQGIGKTLLNSIEEICRDLRIKRMVTTPSGKIGQVFWDKMGFNYFNSIEAEKILESQPL